MVKQEYPYDAADSSNSNRFKVTQPHFERQGRCKNQLCNAQHHYLYYLEKCIDL